MLVDISWRISAYPCSLPPFLDANSAGFDDNCINWYAVDSSCSTSFINSLSALSKSSGLGFGGVYSITWSSILQYFKCWSTWSLVNLVTVVNT